MPEYKNFYPMDQPFSHGGAMAGTTLQEVWFETPRGVVYQAWRVRVQGKTLVLTTAELERAQQRGCVYERDMPGWVARQSAAGEAPA